MLCEDIQVVRSALGRIGFIGELYDIRSERLTSRSIFKSGIPSNCLKSINTSNTSFQYQFTEKISDRFELLNVEAELQVSLLCGLLEAEGCGKFLSEELKSAKNVSCSLICRFQTVCEKLLLPYEEISHHLDTSALNDFQYTHVIVEANWGAHCLLSFEKNFQSDYNKKEIEGSLGAEIKKLANFLSFRGKGLTEFGKESRFKESDIRIKVVADVVPEGEMPTTVEAFCEFLSKIPESLKFLNDGKGKPLSYAMIPLRTIRKIASVSSAIDVVVQGIDESFTISVVCLFEEIASSKQKLYDFVAEMKEYQNYLPEDKILQGKKVLESFRVKECQLKELIAEDWFLVRSGAKSLRDLIKRFEKFRTRDLNLFEIDEYFSSVHFIRRKIDTVKNYVSHGAVYLNRGKILSNELIKSINLDVVVLLVSSAFEAADAELYQKTCHYFLSSIERDLPKTKYVVVDLDLDFSDENQNVSNGTFFRKLGISGVRCLRFKRAEIESFDLYGDYLLDKKTNFARVKVDIGTQSFQQRPGNRIILEITCPGFKRNTCPMKKVKWNCFRCRENIEYGFDKYFYCSCGRQEQGSLEYRCSHDNHGDAFFEADNEFLSNELGDLRPFKELNMLVLGQSGVGKSTWINSIVNYLNYESLEEAKTNGVICTIPIKFSTYDRATGEQMVIEMGRPTDEEITESGQSGTQVCTTYSFLWEDRYIRIIDTPGIGDTRGIQQDKENMKIIMDHICHLKELHCICILMKANDCRINAFFSYCIKELLIQMHKGIAKNIVFCFTNARNSFYTPGQTSVLLEKQLESLQVGNLLSMGHHNRFCVDNEAFLFLCTLNRSKIKHDNTLISSFSQSWEISLRETLRLFTTVKTFKPHMLQETLSLFTARNRILILSRPIAEISKTIQMNLTALARKKEELYMSEKTLEELSKKLYVNEVHLEPVPLDFPRTVCTSSKCVEYRSVDGLDITEIEYVTHCHKVCRIKEVIPKAVNNALLMECKVMDADGNCLVCGCNWRNHMHITFAQKRTERQRTNKEIENDILKRKFDKVEIEEFVRTLQAKTEKYEREQNFIIQVSVKFGMFLKENAISVYNDSVCEYLEYLIKEEENKPLKTESDEKLLANLKETLSHYEAEVKILQDVVRKDGEKIVIPSVEDIFELEQKLYDLELFGSDIKKSAHASRSTSMAALSYRETPLKIPSQSAACFEKDQEKKTKWKFF